MSRLRAVLLVTLLLPSCASFDRGAHETPDLSAEWRKTPPPAQAGEITPRNMRGQKDLPTIVLGPDGRRQPAQRVKLSGGSAGDEKRDIRLSLIDTPVKEFAKLVFQDALKANYILGGNVSAVVSLEINKPVTRSELIDLADEALKLAGLTLQKKSGAFIISRGGQQGPALPKEIRTISLVNADPARIREALAPFAVDGATVALAPDGGSLILSGPKNAVDNLQRIARLLDAERAATDHVAFIPLSNAKPADLAKELTALFRAKQGANAPLRATPVERLRAIILSADEKPILTEAREWTKLLDSPTPTKHGRIFLYPAKNRPAGELAQLLQGLYDASKQTVSAPVRAGAIGAPLHVRGGGVDIRIQTDPGRNALIISGSQQDFLTVRASLDRLDRPQRQVRIDASIIEVTLNDELRYGVRWFFEGGVQDVQLDGAFSDLESGAIAAVSPGFSLVLNATDARVVVDALDSATNVKVVSAPTLVVLDGETARLQVGDQVPVVTRSAASVSDPDAPIVNQVDFRDTGVILEVTPRVYADGLVRMDVKQEVSDVAATTTSGIDSPTIQQRKLSSNLAVKWGETVILGGLTRKRQSEGRTGVPLLSRIPVIGGVFGSTDESENRTELLVTLRPSYVGGE